MACRHQWHGDGVSLDGDTITLDVSCVVCGQSDSIALSVAEVVSSYGGEE